MKGKISNWLQNIYHIGMLVSIIFIMVQAYYARSSMIRTSEWEKAKMTIENIERFKENVKSFPIYDIWFLGDNFWADASTPEGYKLADTLRSTYYLLFESRTDATNEMIRMVEVMDAFAFPIIMGYASEEVSYQSVIRQYSTYSNFIMPSAFKVFQNIGANAKLLYKLWRIRLEILIIDTYITEYVSTQDSDVFNPLRERFDHMLCFEGTKEDISETSLKAYRKKLGKKLKEMQKEIAVFRKNSLK
jgi:hypothetical protein